MPSGSGPTSPTPSVGESRKNSIDSNFDMNDKNGSALNRTISYDPTEYVQKARITKAAPPKPAYNPMQFVQIKPCNLYQSAQEQLKRSEEVKKVKEVKKEDAEEWQNNLDNWKSSRRKRVEHIIDRVVEVKKLEMEEHDRNRRKSKTFSEMMEERGSRRKLSIAVFTEDDTNDLSDLGIGTSSASGKSSLSDDFDNQSVISDNQDTEKSLDLDTNHMNGNRDFVSSPGYETSSSTAPTSSPDPSEYTYEGAIQDYKTRVSRAGQPNVMIAKNGGGYNGVGSYSKESTPERKLDDYTPRKKSFSAKIEDKLLSIEQRATEYESSALTDIKKDLPKVNILKRRELFEKDQAAANGNESNSKTIVGRLSSDFSNAKSIKERLSSLERKDEDVGNATTNGTAAAPTLANGAIRDATVKKINRLSGDLTSIKDRLSNLEKSNANAMNEKNNKIDVTLTATLKDRLSSLQSAVKSNNGNQNAIEDEQKMKTFSSSATAATAVAAVTAAMSATTIASSTVSAIESAASATATTISASAITPSPFDEEDDVKLNENVEKSVGIVGGGGGGVGGGLDENENENFDTDREDSGIHTTDVSCSVSQSDDQTENNMDELNQITENYVEQQQQLNQDNNNQMIIIPDLIPTTMTTVQSMSGGNQLTSAAEQQLLNGEDLDRLENENENEIDLAEHDTSVIDALEMAFQEIDNEKQLTLDDNDDKECDKIIDEIVSINNGGNINNLLIEPIYENLNDVNLIGITAVQQSKIVELNVVAPPEPAIIPAPAAVPIAAPTAAVTREQLIENEPYYQVPKPVEPYYEVPKSSKPVPLYENVDIFYMNSNNKYSMMMPNGEHHNQLENLGFPIGTKTFLEPPKEKPPPPPVDETDDDEDECNDDERHSLNDDDQSTNGAITEVPIIDPFKRINSTKRIKKEIRNKRSSFLGIEGSADDDSYLELSVAPPPDMAALLQEERRLEKQLIMKSGFYENSDTGESRDSGVSENHSRQSSDPFTTSSEEQENYIKTQEKEIIEVLEKEERRRSNDNTTEHIKIDQMSLDEEERMKCLEDQIREQENYHKRQRYHDDSFDDEQSEEVLRVERELLQLEQEELKRQRENLIQRENLARRELDHGVKMLMSANRHSLQDINESVGHYANLPNAYQVYQIQTDYRQSMPDLQNMMDPNNAAAQKNRYPPTPPAKPLRAAQFTQEYQNTRDSTVKCSRVPSADTNLDIIHMRNNSMPQQQQPPQQQQQQYVQLRNGNDNTASLLVAQQQQQQNPSVNLTHFGGNMSKHTLHALSAVPKPKLTNDWVQHRKSNEIIPKDCYIESWKKRNETYVNNTIGTGDIIQLRNKTVENNKELWQLNQQKRKSDGGGVGFNYKHWLIQEAEQRRIDQQRGMKASVAQNNWNNSNSSNRKSLPDAVIQTITQRVQNLGIGDKKRSLMEQNSLTYTNSGVEKQIIISPNGHVQESHQDKILSVSGKKKCSHCENELGRGAAMIIESLRLFYHIDCFKCCVCHIQLGDGLNGTDVRVRNHKLHCHNCYSSDDGVKFSCV